MTGLLFAEKMAGPANLQIGRRNSKPRAQFCELLNGHQPLLRVGAERAFVGRKKIRVGLLAGTADPSA